MNLSDRLQRVVAPLPVGALVTLPVEILKQWRSEEAHASPPTPAPVAAPTETT
ncbi:MAG: hypothetical protein H0U67_03335 [Gemmatimonadetes bacterium]|nr:hypothetical protein [Gemmatimonadota bacterium]